MGFVLFEKFWTMYNGRRTTLAWTLPLSLQSFIETCCDLLFPVTHTSALTAPLVV